MFPVFSDLSRTARALGRDRSFALTALATFALCVAANVAIFAVVRAVLLRPLPFPEADRLVTVFNSYPKAGAVHIGSSVPHYLERKENLKSLAAMAAVRSRDVIVGEAGRPERVSAVAVTPEFFEVLRVTAARGRTFRPEEGEEGKTNCVVLSHGYWQQRLGGDPAAVGQTLRIDGVPMTIVGVLPAGFSYAPAKEARLWVPLAFRAADRAADRRHSNNIEVIGRLVEGATVARAQAEVEALNAKMLEADPYRQVVLDAGFRTDVVALRDDLTRDARSALWMLQGGALLVLVIGAVNLANLILVRASVRTKEMAIRRVLGAGATTIARQVWVENLLLAGVGGVLGVALGAGLLPLLRPLGLADLPRGGEARVDLVVALVALAAALLVGTLLAVAPLVQHLGGKLGAALSVESRGGTTHRRQSRLREALIVAQIALAFVLLTGAGLLTLSFARVLKVDPGFRAENVVSAHLYLPRPRYEKAEAKGDYVRRLLAALQGLPGVKSVALSSAAPFSGQADSNAITVEGYQPAPGESVQAPFQTWVVADFFETYGFHLREGRFLTLEDGENSAKVTVIDERFARRYWPNSSPIGHRIIEGTADDAKADRYTVVGVVGNVKQNDLAETANVGAVYMAYPRLAAGNVIVTVRSDLAAATVSAAMQAAALRIDPEVPLFDVQTLTERVTNTLGARRTPMVLAGVFAAGALLLAVVGIYGVLAYAVAQRRREIGIRLALGALPGQVHGMFLRLGARLLLIGLVLGAPLVWWFGTLLRGQLFGIEPANPWVLTGGAVFIGFAALLAAFIPARRAAATPAMEALRAD